jgi:hypothetical protein
MTGLKIDLAARDALRFVIAAGFLVMLGANLPGHLSYDSVSQLSEGHFQVRSTWGPVLYAWMLGFFDRLVPGAPLYIAASGLLFFGALASLADLRSRTSWLAVAVAVLVVLTPQVLIYQAIVWKDVAFANTAIAGLICLAHAARDWTSRRRWLWLACAVVLLAVATQVRQNGLVAAFLAAIALGWIAGAAGTGARWRRGFAWGLGGFVAVMLVAKAMTTLAMATMAQPADALPGNATATGIAILQKYDVVGATALDPTYRLDIMAAAQPVATATVRERAKADYSGRRVDFIDRDPVISAAIGAIPDHVTSDQWVDLVTKHPGLYLRLRWEDFRWLVIPPVIDFCLPVYVGVDAPAPLMEGLKMQHRYVQADVELTNYATWFFDTPAFSHLAYALISLVLAGLLLLRRQPADIPIAAMQLAGVGFEASFFLISIACDYRYLYFTDLAALTGLVYVALDPPLPWRKKA